MIGTQIVLLMLAAPAATAGAICLDKQRGALTHLLVTDLSDAEIILGKLAARLVPVFGLLLGSLPIVALSMLLGGVDPRAVMGGLLISLGVAVLGCSLALTFSVWASKTHEVLLATYAVMGLWLLAIPAARFFGYRGRGTSGRGRTGWRRPTRSAWPSGPIWCPGRGTCSGGWPSSRRRRRSRPLLLILATGRLRPVASNPRQPKDRRARVEFDRPPTGLDEPPSGAVARRQPGPLARMAPGAAVPVDPADRAGVRGAAAFFSAA